MKRHHPKGRYDAAAIHDGQAWRLVVAGGAEAILAGKEFFHSPANKLPQDLVDAARAAGVRRLIFLVSGDVHMIDGAIPPGAGLDKVNEQIRLAIAEATGVETADELVAGMTTNWPGVRKPFTAAFRFDADAAADFHAALDEAGIACAGIASLELALLAVWRKRATGRQTFVAVTSGHAFVVPAPRGANPGPQSVACGLRHLATDEANWRTRFQRSAAALDKTHQLHLLVLGADTAGSSTSVPDALREAGYADVSEESPDVWLAEAVRTALASKPNRCRNVAVPVVNPWEPHRKFSSFWIVAAVVLILALPSGFRFWCAQASGRRCGALAQEAARLKPKAEKVKAAQKALAQAKTSLAAAKAEGTARISLRRPLMAFVDVAYFFCKHAGSSVVLTSIRQTGDKIAVSGRFGDPEDGVRLNKAVLAYAKERNIEIVENAATTGAEGGSGVAEDGLPPNSFRLVFNCARIGEALK